MERGRKRDAKGTRRLQMHSALTAFPPPRCLRVLGKAVLTNRARGRVRVSVGKRDKNYCSSWSRAGKGLLRDRLSAKVALVGELARPSHGWESWDRSQPRSAFWTKVWIRVCVGRGAKPISLFSSGAGSRLPNQRLSC